LSRGFVAIRLQSPTRSDSKDQAFVRGAIAQKSKAIAAAKRRSITPTNEPTRSERSHWTIAAPINISTRINPRMGRKSITLKREPAGADCGSFVVYARSVSSGSIEHGHLSSRAGASPDPTIHRDTCPPGRMPTTITRFHRPYYSPYFPLMQPLISCIAEQMAQKNGPKA